MWGSGSCRVRILKPFPERSTDVISIGDETSSSTDGNGSESTHRIKDVETGRKQCGELPVRIHGSELATRVKVRCNMMTSKMTNVDQLLYLWQHSGTK